MLITICYIFLKFEFHSISKQLIHFLDDLSFGVSSFGNVFQMEIFGNSYVVTFKGQIITWHESPYFLNKCMIFQHKSTGKQKV
ncbi:hypothetical protein SDC9_109628 [bioreactor metagenome]|uniref:Uncharacterized protein n=1 Tax=bioreactor metagenome TaxID=1076179 RepID=A0A645BDN3_9ZZZZ